MDCDLNRLSVTKLSENFKKGWELVAIMEEAANQGASSTAFKSVSGHVNFTERCI